MTHTTDSTARQDPSRRQAIRMLAGGVAALAMGACTPATIVLKAYPEEYRKGSDATEAALLAFIDTVVPGLTPAERRAVTVLHDPFYPLSPYSDFLASDLDRRSRKRYRSRFSILPLDQRTTVVEAGFSGDTITRKLYTGAAFLVQAAVYAGIQDDRAGSRLIDFPGGYTLTPTTTAWLPGAPRFASWASTTDGNPA
ncbi:MAG TPA: hypothetical protein PKA66_09195 [Gemmatimonadales bacterium]|nr:hypothetical protein [Gemmatimonadales bacterium]